jgi:hypothetical protein
MEPEKKIDESWKQSVEKEKVHIFGQEESVENAPVASPEGEEEPQLDFSNYIASLGFQALVFMGEIPNPMTNEIQKNLPQSKFLIDTLLLLREKTKGNLTEQEERLLNGSVYELQMKFVEVLQKEQGAQQQ